MGAATAIGFDRKGSIEIRAIQCGMGPSVDEVLERLALWWGQLQQHERGALCVLGRLPLSVAYEGEFSILDDKEQKAILNAVKGGGVLCDLVMQGGHGYVGH